MATATKHAFAPAPPPPYTLTLELSQEEAELLITVLGGIYGGPESLRRVNRRIFQALDGKSVKHVAGHTFAGSFKLAF